MASTNIELSIAALTAFVSVIITLLTLLHAEVRAQGRKREERDRMILDALARLGVDPRREGTVYPVEVLPRGVLPAGARARIAVDSELLPSAAEGSARSDPQGNPDGEDTSGMLSAEDEQDEEAHSRHSCAKTSP
jgi:hypothetical protein